MYEAARDGMAEGSVPPNTSVRRQGVGRIALRQCAARRLIDDVLRVLTEEGLI
jgi:hypothetical protein